MFNDIETISTDRLIEIRVILEMIKNQEPPHPNVYPHELTALKGLFFVQIYGAFEYTISSIIARTIDSINSKSVPINEYKPILLSILLDPDFDTLTSTGRATKWEKRWSLLEKLENNNVVLISNHIFPTDGHNIRYKQLESIWKTFGIRASILNAASLGGRIKEIVDYRNSIAHGNTSAAEIGRTVTIEDLFDRYEEMSRYFTYLFGVFNEYITQEHYKKIVIV